MRKKFRLLLIGVMLVSFMFAGSQLLAQEGAEGEGAQTEQQEGGGQAGFVTIVFKGGIVNTVVWMLIFAASGAVVALVIDAVLTLKRSKLRPDELVDGVRESLNEGDLDAAVENCESNPCPLSTILLVGFSNISEGYEVIQESVSSSAEMENEKLLQRVNYLNLCGQISPMLGLLGTVLGMVRAFAGLAGASGAAKATILAESISTALWTTATGLLIAVPALLAYTLLRNHATRLILDIEGTVTDLIKVLRNAEVEEGEEELEDEEEFEEGEEEE